jgi:hypothetical protein
MKSNEIHLGHKFHYFLQMFYKWPLQRFLGFENDFEKSPNFEISHLGAKVISFKIWVPSSFSHNFLHFPRLVYPSQDFPTLSKQF